MIRLVPEPSAEIANPLRSILGRIVAAGATPPAWVAVADDDGRWLVHAMSASPAERAAAVAAVGSDSDLGRAVELGFGGAVWLPPSTFGAREALTSAAVAAGQPAPVCDPRLVELIDDREDVQGVTFARLDFWRREVGSAHLLALLAALASRLGVPPLLVEAPALLVAGVAPAAVRSAWNEVVGAARYAPLHGLVVIPLDGDVGETSRLTGLLEESRAVDGDHAGASRWRPVWEIPSGRRLGWWSVGDSACERGPGWRAQPSSPAPCGHRWRIIDGDDETREVPDVVDAGSLEAGPGDVVRVPARLAVALRTGSPAALAVARLAEEAERRRARVWVSGIDAEALGILLRLRQTMWVDGPAVPEE